MRRSSPCRPQGVAALENIAELHGYARRSRAADRALLSHYKDLEPGKWAKIHHWGDTAEAEQRIVEAIARRRNRAELPPCDVTRFRQPRPEATMLSKSSRADEVLVGAGQPSDVCRFHVTIGSLRDFGRPASVPAHNG